MAIDLQVTNRWPEPEGSAHTREHNANEIKLFDDFILLNVNIVINKFIFALHLHQATINTS